MSIEEKEETGLPIAEIATGGANGASSVADVLRAGYRRAQQDQKPKDIVLPGYGEPDSELHVTFRALTDYEEVRAEIRKALKRRNVRPGLREIQLGIETLLLAADGSYAVVGGEEHQIGKPLGLELYEHLFPGGDVPGPETDGQAVHLLFHENTTVLMSAYMELDQWIRRGGYEAEEELLGE